MTPLLALAAVLLPDGLLKVGEPAPDFALPDQTGAIRRLADYRGRTVVLLFFPKDFTPG